MINNYLLTATTSDIEIFRKKAELQYANTFIDALVNYYYVYVASNCILKGNAEYLSVKESLKSLNRQIDTKPKEHVYEILTYTIDMDLVEEANEEVAKEKNSQKISSQGMIISLLNIPFSDVTLDEKPESIAAPTIISTTVSASSMPYSSPSGLTLLEQRHLQPNFA